MSPKGLVIVGAGLRTARAGDLAAAAAALSAPAPPAPPAPAWRADEPFFDFALPRELDAQVKFLNGSGRLALAAVAAAVGGPEDLGAVAPERRSLYLAQMDSYDWDAPDLRPAVLGAEREGDAAPSDEAINRAAVRRVKPFFLLESLKNNAFAFVSTWLGLRGPNTGVAGYGGATGPLLEVAARALARTRTDLVLFVAAARPTSPIAGLELLRHGLPPGGAVPADGAAALLLCRAGTAADLGRRPWARLAGLGVATGAAGAPGAGDAEALAEAARAALAEAGVAGPAVARVFAPARARPALAPLGLAPGEWIDSAAHLGDLGLAHPPADLALAAALPPGGPTLVLEAGWLQQAAAAVLLPPG